MRACVCLPVCLSVCVRVCVIVIVIGNGHGEQSSNPGPG